MQWKPKKSEEQLKRETARIDARLEWEANMPKAEKEHRELWKKKAKRALGIPKSHDIPRCGHKNKSLAKRLAKAGDSSHLADGHVCAECACLNIAGSGTTHPGVGWCFNCEKGEPFERCKNRALATERAIKQGYPMEVVSFSDGGQFLEKINTQADEAMERISLKKQLGDVKELGDAILSKIGGGNTVEGFTESGKDGPTEASDATLVKLYTGLLTPLTRLAKIELEVAEMEYVHWDEVKVYFGQIAQIVSDVVDDDALFDKILMKWSTVKEPGSGKRKKRK